MSKDPSSKGREPSAFKWTLDADTIVSTLFEQALRGLETHGCRPRIRGRLLETRPASGVVIFDYSSLRRDDFEDLDELRDEINVPIPQVYSAVTPDHIRNHRDIRGIAFDLLTDTILFAEQLDGYRSGPSPERLEAMLSSLYSAAHTGGVLHNSYDANFESDMRKFRQQAGQTKGRRSRGERASVRHAEFVKIAQDIQRKKKRAGTKLNLSKLAREVIEHCDAKGKPASPPGPSQMRKILSDHREHLK